MKKLFSLLSATFLIIGVSSLAASAQLVTVDYPGNGDPGSLPPFPATVSNSSSVTASYGFGSNLQLDTNGFYNGFIASAKNAVYPATLLGAETNGTDYTFTVAPIAGDMLSLSSFDLSNTHFSSQTASGSFTLESNLTGTVPLATYAEGSNGGSVDLSIYPTLQNLTGPVTFEIYVYGVTSAYEDVALQALPGNAVTSGSLSINGTSQAVPEPGSYALAGLGLVAAAFVSRLRRMAQV